MLKLLGQRSLPSAVPPLKVRSSCLTVAPKAALDTPCTGGGRVLIALLHADVGADEPRVVTTG